VKAQGQPVHFKLGYFWLINDALPKRKRRFAVEKWFKKFNELHPSWQTAVFTLFSLLVAAYAVGIVILLKRLSGWTL
jgi:hypothetical protein